MDAEPAPEAEADAEPAPEDAEGEEAPEGVAEERSPKPPEATTRRSPSRRPWMSRPSTSLTRPREGTRRDRPRDPREGVDVDLPHPESGATPLIVAAAERAVEATTLLLDAAPIPTPRRRTATGAALGVLPRRGDVASVLLNAGADVNAPATYELAAAWRPRGATSCAESSRGVRTPSQE